MRVLTIALAATARWPVGRDFIAVTHNYVEEEMEERFPGLLVDSLGCVIRPKLIRHVNTTHIKIVLVYELWNVHFFNRQVTEGLALYGRISRGLCRSSAAPEDIGITW